MMFLFCSHEVKWVKANVSLQSEAHISENSDAVAQAWQSPMAHGGT
jgi:hypothetical protein